MENTGFDLVGQNRRVGSASEEGVTNKCLQPKGLQPLGSEEKVSRIKQSLKLCNKSLVVFYNIPYPFEEQILHEASLPNSLFQVCSYPLHLCGKMQVCLVRVCNLPGYFEGKRKASIANFWCES